MSIDLTTIFNNASVIQNVTTVNAATYDVLDTDTILNVTYTATAAVTSLTLLSATAIAGKVLTIKDAGGSAGTNNITIDTEGAETINGAATYVIAVNGQTVELYCDGTNWQIKNIIPTQEASTTVPGYLTSAKYDEIVANSLKQPTDAPTFTSSIGLTSGDITASNGNIVIGTTAKGITSAQADLNISATTGGVNVTTHTDAGDDFTVNSTTLVITGDTQQVIIGDDTPIDIAGGATPGLSLVASDSKSYFAQVRYGNNASGPSFCFAKSRDTTPDGYTIVSNSDSLGEITWTGADGTDFATVQGRIQVFVDDASPAENQIGGRMVFGTSATTAGTTTTRLTIGNTGVVDVVGELTAGTKTFKIDHPVLPTEKILYHAVVESPEHGLMYRGKVKLIAGKITINMDSYLGMTIGTFSALTQDVIVQSLQNQDSFDRLKVGAVTADTFEILCENINSTDEVSFLITACRKDSFVKHSSLNDENGRLILEVEKQDMSLKDLDNLKDEITYCAEKDSETIRIVDNLGCKKGYYLHPESFGTQQITKKIINIKNEKQEK